MATPPDLPGKGAMEQEARLRRERLRSGKKPSLLLVAVMLPVAVVRWGIRKMRPGDSSHGP